MSEHKVEVPHGDIYVNGQHIGDFATEQGGDTLICNVDGDSQELFWEEPPGAYVCNFMGSKLRITCSCTLWGIDGCGRWDWIMEYQLLPSLQWVTIGGGTFAKTP